MQTIKNILGPTKMMLLAGLLLFIGKVSMAQIDMRGNVVSGRGHPLEGVTISASWPKHPAWTELGTTHADGEFHIVVPIDSSKPSAFVDLKFTKNEYAPQRRNINLTRMPIHLKITLLHKSQIELDREVRKFERFKKELDQHAIFISSFNLLNEPFISESGDCKCEATDILTPCEKKGVTRQGIECECPQSKSEQIHCNIERHIFNHLMSKMSEFARISVIAISPRFDSSDVDNLEYLGSYLNALGVITGDGSLIQGTGNKRLLAITSTFLIPSKVENMFHPRLKLITEEFPEKEIDNVRLSERLDEFWAHYTLLGLAERETIASRTQSDYRRIITYLRKARNLAANADHKKDLDELIERVRLEMEK